MREFACPSHSGVVRTTVGSRHMPSPLSLFACETQKRVLLPSSAYGKWRDGIKKELAGGRGTLTAHFIVLSPIWRRSRRRKRWHKLPCRNCHSKKREQGCGGGGKEEGDLNFKELPVGWFRCQQFLKGGRGQKHDNILSSTSTSPPLSTISVLGRRGKETFRIVVVVGSSGGGGEGRGSGGHILASPVCRM